MRNLENSGYSGNSGNSENSEKRFGSENEIELKIEKDLENGMGVRARFGMRRRRWRTK